MHRLRVAIAGFGGVGRATANLLLQRRERYRQVYGVDVRLVAVCGSRAGLADANDLPQGCTLLASTSLCRHQAFARGPNVLGLQFHAEVRGDRFEHWLLGHASELATSGIDPVTLRRDARRHANALERAGTTLLEQWLATLHH